MRVEFQMESTGIAFFPGQAQPVAVDSGELPEGEAAELERLVRAARLFDRPTVAAPPPGAADYRRYTITVEDGGRRHTVQLADPVEDPDLQALLDYLKEKAKASRGARARPSDPGAAESG